MPQVNFIVKHLSMHSGPIQRSEWKPENIWSDFCFSVLLNSVTTRLISSETPLLLSLMSIVPPGNETNGDLNDLYLWWSEARNRRWLMTWAQWTTGPLCAGTLMAAWWPIWPWHTLMRRSCSTPSTMTGRLLKGDAAPHLSCEAEGDL